MVGYVPGSSGVHRLDPVAKLAVLLAMLVLAVIFGSAWWLGFLLLFILFLFLAAGLPFSVVLKKSRFIVYFSLMIFVSYIIFVRHGPIVLSLPLLYGFAFNVHLGAVEEGAAVALRFLSIVLASMWFISTTHPGKLSRSLVRHGLPFRYGFLITLTLRFIPLFQAESSIVQDAQRARGLKIDVRGPTKLLRLARYTYMPLLVSALSRVDTVALSMESRGMDVSDSRTFLMEQELDRVDKAVIFLAVSCSIFALVLYWGIITLPAVPSIPLF